MGRGDKPLSFTNDPNVSKIFPKFNGEETNSVIIKSFQNETATPIAKYAVPEYDYQCEVLGKANNIQKVKVIQLRTINGKRAAEIITIEE